MFKIGEFSKLVRVSPRMLRHYEKCGLLYPAEVDRFTGYRMYSAVQMPLISNIVMLRDMGFSIEEIGDILPHLKDKVYMDKILRSKKVSLQAVIANEQEKLTLLIKMSDTLREESLNMIYEVELKKLPSVKVLALKEVIPSYEMETQLWEKIGAFMAKNGITCSTEGGGYSIYHDEDYKESDVEVEIAVPVPELKENMGEFVYKVLDAIELAATIRFSGPYEGTPAATEKLGAWMENNGYEFAGSMRGLAIASPQDQSDPANYLTELQIPVVKK